MSATSLLARPKTPPTGRSLMCGEVAGGNEPVRTTVELPGLRGTLFSRPCEGARGGDVHYLSVCGAGLFSRVCVADVAGHGETVAKVGHLMHTELRRSVDVIDERCVFRDMDRRLGTMGTRAMTTAALVTYYTPRRRLTFSYAGHPPGWLFRRAQGRWERLERTAPKPEPLQGLPLGTGFASEYARHRVAVDVGDRVVLVTDGVLEAPRPSDDAFFGAEGIGRVLDAAQGQSCEELTSSLVAALQAHMGRTDLTHDDVTVFVAEIVPGPAGPAIWHVLKNRYLRRSRHPRA